MSRSLADARRWVTEGTELFVEAAGGLDEASYDDPTLLPGWTRRHLVAHVAANADAIGNLVRWAATGEETPMYASPQERAEGIERGVSMSGRELDDWLRRSAESLETAMSDLTPEQWTTEVVTAQGRTVPAAETPWMRSREVCVHAFDLDLGIGFADLPADFLEALVVDITAKRGDVPPIDGSIDQHAAWLAGRPHDLPDAPGLPPWL